MTYTISSALFALVLIVVGIVRTCEDLRAFRVTRRSRLLERDAAQTFLSRPRAFSTSFTASARFSAWR